MPSDDEARQHGLKQHTTHVEDSRRETKKYKFVGREFTHLLETDDFLIHGQRQTDNDYFTKNKKFVGSEFTRLIKTGNKQGFFII